MRMLSITLASTLLLSATALAGGGIGERPTAQQIVDAEGSYLLENGERIRVFGLDNRLYVELGHHRKELVVAGPGRFASKDGSVSLLFDPDGDADKVVLGYRRDADGGIPARMAAADQRLARAGAD